MIINCNLFQWTPCQARFLVGGNSDTEISQSRLLSRVSSTIIYDDELGLAWPGRHSSKLVIFSKAISWRKPLTALVKRQIPSCSDDFVLKFVNYLLFIVTLDV